MVTQTGSKLVKYFVILLLAVFLPLTAAAQNSVRHYLPVKQSRSSSMGGPTQGGLGYDIGRTNEYVSDTSALVTAFTDFDFSYLGDSGWTYVETPQEFSGHVQVLDDRSIILLPASFNSPYEVRELSIRHDGYILADRYLQGISAGLEYYYSYNADNVAILELMHRWSESEASNYTKSEYVCDSEGRRLQANISVSLDSLDWQAAMTRQYTYSGEALDSGKDYEKYSYYSPRDHSLSNGLHLDFPYVCNNWKLMAMTETSGSGGSVVTNYQYGSYGEIDYAPWGYNWDSIGLPQNRFQDWDVHHISYSYTWRRLYVDNSDEVQSPVLDKLRVYPNPFNPSTTVEFELSKSSSPVIKVYNVRGQICRTHGPGTLAAGTHSWHFDGKDMRGNTLPSGVYLVKMEVPGKNVVMRINLLK